MSSNEVGRVLDGLASAVAAVGDIDLGVLSPAERAGFVGELEAVAARFAAAQVGVLDDVDRAGWHHCDAMRTARCFVRYHAKLSGGEARGRWQTVVALRSLPEVAAAFSSGEIGVPQARRFARTWANPRVRDALADAQGYLLGFAHTEQYAWFDRLMAGWERRADPDGTADRERGVDTAALTQLFDGTWSLSGRFTAATGALLDEILSAYVAAELASDWSVAREDHGPDATEAHLPRTPAQRRADAIVAIFLDAVTTPPGGREPRFVLNLLMSWEEYQTELTRLTRDAGRGGDDGCQDHHSDGDSSDGLSDGDEDDLGGGEPCGGEACDTSGEGAATGGLEGGPVVDADELSDCDAADDHHSEPYGDEPTGSDAVDDRGGEPVGDAAASDPAKGHDRDEPCDYDAGSPANGDTGSIDDVTTAGGAEVDADAGHGDRPGDGSPGHAPPPPPRTTPPRSRLPGRYGGATHHSGTQNGQWIDPWDIIKWSWGAELRRAVIGADGTVIDLGRTARFFTGTARDAVMLASPRCIWAGCDTPTTRTHADHTLEHARGGPTNPHNGLPLCGHHNRLKNHRFRVWRDPAGTFHTTRPDGTEI